MCVRLAFRNGNRFTKKEKLKKRNKTDSSDLHENCLEFIYGPRSFVRPLYEIMEFNRPKTGVEPNLIAVVYTTMSLWAKFFVGTFSFCVTHRRKLWQRERKEENWPKLLCRIQASEIYNKTVAKAILSNCKIKQMKKVYFLCVCLPCSWYVVHTQHVVTVYWIWVLFLLFRKRFFVCVWWLQFELTIE